MKLWNTVKKRIQISRVEGLDEVEQTLFEELVEVWESKLDRNEVRIKYYNMKNHLKDLGIAIPPELRNIEAVSGWPAKAVDLLAARSRFDGFVFDDGQDSKLTEVLKANSFSQTYKEAVASELMHSCSFITLSKGLRGEPAVLIMPHSALTAAAVWDYRKRRIKAGLVIIEIDEKTKQPTEMNLYTDKAVIEITGSGHAWKATKHLHSQGRPLMEALRYRPSIDRPMGKSRINRAVMSITDNAVRQISRTEIASEFYTWPQRYVLGADEKDFDKGKIQMYMSVMALFGRDENGDTPTFGQLPQMTMQPHLDYMRSLAAQFAGETGIPVSSLGVIHDNPSSADAIYAAREDLIIEAEDLNMTNGVALRNIGLMTLAIMQGKSISGLSSDELTIMPKFKNPAKPSIVSQSDAMVKQVSAAAWLAETQVFLEELGYTDEQIARMTSDKLKAEGRKTLAQALDLATGGAQAALAGKTDTGTVQVAEASQNG